MRICILVILFHKNKSLSLRASALVIPISFSLSSQQMAFTTVHFKAHENSQNDIAELYEKHYAEYKS